MVYFGLPFEKSDPFFGKSSGVVEWRPDGGGGGPARLVVDYF